MVVQHTTVSSQEPPSLANKPLKKKIQSNQGSLHLKIFESPELIWDPRFSYEPPLPRKAHNLNISMVFIKLLGKIWWLQGGSGAHPLFAQKRCENSPGLWPMACQISLIIPTSLYPFNPSSIHPFIPSSSLLPFIHASLHPFIPSSIHPLILLPFFLPSFDPLFP